MPFNSAHPISLWCTLLSSKVVLNNDPIFQALSLDLWRHFYCCSWNMNMIVVFFTHWKPTPLVCFALFWFYLVGSIHIIISLPFIYQFLLEPKWSILLHKAGNGKNGTSWKRFCLLLKSNVYFQTEIFQGKLTALNRLETGFHNLNYNTLITTFVRLEIELARLRCIWK